MNTISFIQRLKQSLPEPAWPWVIMALRQEPIIWESIQDPDFCLRAIPKDASQLEVWSPAALALNYLALPVSLNSLRTLPYSPLEPEINQVVVDAYNDLGKPVDAGIIQRPTLILSALLALYLHEHRWLTGSWASLGDELGKQPQLAWRTTMACLHGMIPDPFDLLHALITQSSIPGGYSLALYALLCNPGSPEEQVDILRTLIAGNQNIQPLPSPERLTILRELSTLRPSLATELARRLIADQSTDQLSDVVISTTHSIEADTQNLVEGLDHLIQTADTCQIANNTEGAISILKAAQKITCKLHAELCAQTAQLTAQTTRSVEVLANWQQAVEMAPDNPFYQAGLAVAMIEAGKSEEVRVYQLEDEDTDHPLEDGLPEQSSYQHPAVLYASARLAAQTSDIERARRIAIQALEEFEKPSETIDRSPMSENPNYIFRRHCQPVLAQLAQFLLDINRPQESARACELALCLNPTDLKLLTLLGHARNASKDFSEAAQAFQLAVILAPDSTDLRRELADNLEAQGEWEIALNERMTLAAGPEPALEDLRSFANCALCAGEPKRAIDICQQAMQKDPDDGLTHALLGESLTALGDHQLAMEHFIKATQLAPHLLEPWLAMARSLKETGQMQTALDTLRSAVQALPDSPEAHLALGEAYLSSNSPTQALIALQRAAELAPVNYQIALRLGQTLRQLGHLPQARQVLEPAYQATPTHFELAYAYAQTLLALGEARPALPALATVVGSKPDDSAPYLDYARALLEVKEQPEVAVQALQHVLEKDPDLTEAQALIAEALALSGDLSSALQWYQVALESSLAQDQTWKTRLSWGLGRVALALHQPETAIAAFQETANADPSNPQVQQSLAEAYLCAGLQKEAFDTARAALNLAPNELESLTWYANKMVELVRQPGELQAEITQIYSEAVDALAQAVLIAPHRTDLLLKLSQVQLDSGDNAAADESLQKIISIEEATVDNLQQAAQMLLNIGNAESAINCLDRAINIQDPADSVMAFNLLINLVHAYRQARNVDKALETLEKAIQLDPDNSFLYRVKADLLLELGQAETALQCLEDAINQIPGAPDLHERAALILRSMGKLQDALSHAEEMIDASSHPELLPDYQAPGIYIARALAADIARALLQLERARSYLGTIWKTTPEKTSAEQLDSSTVEEPADNYPYAINDLPYLCLCAELALDEGEEIEAAKCLNTVLDMVSEVALESLPPRILAVQARLTARRGDYTTALQTFQEALETCGCQPIDIQNDSNEHVLPSTSFSKSLADYIAIASAALDLGQWEAAIYLSRHATEAAPLEPFTHLNLARALTLRAEYQRLCESLEVIKHAPGPAALSTRARESFQQAIHTAEKYLNSPHSAGEDPSSADTKPVSVSPQSVTYPSSAPIPILIRWRLRGDAVFQPNQQTAHALVERTDSQPDPDDLAAQIAVLRYLGENDRVLTITTHASQSYPNHAPILIQIALVLSEQQPEEALKVVQTILNLQSGTSNPQSTMVNSLLARIGLKLSDYPIALQAVQIALGFWPEEPRWQALAADIYRATNDLQTAISHLEEAIKIEPKYLPYHLTLGDILLAEPHPDINHTKRTLRVLERASRLEPNRPEPWYALARAHLLAGDLNQAASCADNAISFAPELVAPLLLRAEIALRLNDPRAAYERAQASLALHPKDSEATLILTGALQILKRPDEALAAIDEALPCAKSPLPLQLERVNLLRQLPDKGNALEAAINLAQRYPDDPIVLATLAKAHSETGDSDTAILTAQRALQIGGGKLDPTEQARLHHLLGRLLRCAGQLDQSVHHLKEAIQLAPEVLEPYLELGRAHQDRREHRQALQTYQQATTVAPKDPRPYYQAGLALKEGKDYMNAETMLRRAAELAPNDVSIRRQLAGVVALNLVHNRYRVLQERATEDL